MTAFIDDGEPGSWARALRHRTPALAPSTAAAMTGCEGSAPEGTSASGSGNMDERANADQSSRRAAGPPACRPFSLYDFAPFHGGHNG